MCVYIRDEESIERGGEKGSVMSSLHTPLIVSSLEQIKERLRERRQVTDDLVKLMAAHAKQKKNDVEMREEDVQLLLRKVKRLEAKLEQCSVNEGVSFDAMQSRLVYASAFDATGRNTTATSCHSEQMRSVLKRREGVFLADYLARCGYYITAEKLAEQRDVGMLMRLCARVTCSTCVA